MEINELVSKSHKTSVEHGFWDVEKSIPTKLMLIVTELGEACEADRHNNYDNFKEEIADTFIRLADLCGYLNIDIDEEISKKMKINEGRPKLHGKRY